jgi:hypothetical protein
MTKASERRDGPRIDLRLRVRFSWDELSGEAEASDLSPRGMRFETPMEVPAGSNLDMTMDAGDEEELKANGRVTWCRLRKSHSGKDMYDVGIALEEDWLAQDRGPLGTALARIFAMNESEPARSFERTKVSLKASTSSEPPLPLEIVDVSLGGMQLKCPPSAVYDGTAVIVEIQMGDKTSSLDGRVVWIAGDSFKEVTNFGVQFSEDSENEKDLLEDIRKGAVQPDAISVFLQ